MKAVDSFLVCLFVVVALSMAYVIDSKMQDIRVISFRIGCMSVDDAPYEAVRNCMAQAEEKVK